MKGILWFAVGLILALLANAAFAGNKDETIMVEYVWSFGESGAKDGNKKSKICRNRPQNRLHGLFVRYQYDDVEAHVGKMWHDASAKNCNRSTWSIGAGYVLDTEKDGVMGNDDFRLSWTPGFAYLTDTNYRQTSHWTYFNRFALGYDGGKDTEIEVSYLNYGGWEDRHGERFMGVGLRHWDRYDDRPKTVAQNNNGDEEPKCKTDCDTEEPPKKEPPKKEPPCKHKCGDGDDDDDHDDKPGHGHGDKNHGHSGPPGQNKKHDD